MNKDMKKRLKNKGTLVALGAQIMIIIGIVYFYVTGELMPAGLVGNLTLLGGAILMILTTLGILNDPKTDNKGFGDDKKDPPMPPPFK